MFFSYPHLALRSPWLCRYEAVIIVESGGHMAGTQRQSSDSVAAEGTDGRLWSRSTGLSL